MKLLNSLLLAGLATLSAGSALAQARFPERPVTLVVPYPPGASSDGIARILSDRLAKAFGQPVVIENKGGAAGNIGGQYVARGPANGYRVLIATMPIIVINPHIYKDIGYDPMKELMPLANAVRTIFAIAAHPKLPVNNMSQLIAYSKANPKKLFFGTSGAGTPQHLSGMILNQTVGTDLEHVPYKGGGPMVVDLVAGQIPLGIITLSTVLQLGREGKLKILAVGEKARVSMAPDIPAIGEAVPGFEMTGWIGVLGPAAMPRDIAARWSTELVKTFETPDVAKQLETMGMPVWSELRPEQFAAQLKKDYAAYGKVVQDYKITAE